MIYTTLNEIRKHHPCKDGWEMLLKSLGKTKADDEQISFEYILNSNGIDDALWCLRVLPESMDSNIRLLVCDLVEPAMQYVLDGETRPQEAIRIARAYANGEASIEELGAAADAAWAAADAADAAWAAEDAADAARAAEDAAWAARSAARAAEDAAWAAETAAWAAARDAREECINQHEAVFRKWLQEVEV